MGGEAAPRFPRNEGPPRRRAQAGVRGEKLEDQGAVREDRLRHGRRQAARPALGDRRCRTPGADAAGLAESRSGHPHRFSGERTGGRGRQGHRRCHAARRPAVAGRGAAGRAGQRRRVCAEPGDARPLYARHPRRMEPGARGRYRRPAPRDRADRRRAGADGPDGRLPDDPLAGLGPGLYRPPPRKA